MESLSMPIEKLTKSNYDTWKLQIEALLIKNDHWDFVNGTLKKPDPSSVGNETELSQWIKSDQKARADIILSINPSELCHIKHCNTSNQMWEKLKSIHESKGPAKKATLLKQLLFTKMTEHNTMSDHLNAMFNTVDKLCEMEVDITHDLLTIIILYSIPDSYENFRVAMESRDELPKPDFLKIKLLEEFTARKAKEKNAYETPKAFLTHTRAPEYYPIKCHYCHKKGHKISECRKKIFDMKRNKSSREKTLLTDAEQATTTLSKGDHYDQKNHFWCLDSGATSHMCHNKSLFTEFIEMNDAYVKLAVNKNANIIGKGTVKISVQTKNKIENIRLEEVLCVPELKNNLISVSKASNNNNTVTFKQNDAKITNSKGEIILCAKRKGNLYYTETITETASLVTEFEQWHQRYGHLNQHDLKRLQELKMVRGLKFNPSDPKYDCKVCIESKLSALPLPKASKYKSTCPLNIVHSDICGPMRTKSLGGSLYFLTFIDDMSKYVQVYFLKSKSEVKETFIKYKALFENKLNSKIKILRTDNGLEYLSKEFSDYLDQYGIKRQRTTAYTPQQNGCAERMNRTLVEMARCLLLQSSLPHTFWAEAVNTAAYLRNRSPTKSLTNQTPYEALLGTKPSVSHLRTFGQKAYYLNKKPQKDKFEPRSYKCTFIGYSEESKAYRLWDPHTQKTIVSRDVKFIDEFENSGNYDTDGDYFWIEPSISDDEREGGATAASDEQSSTTDEEPSSSPVQLPKSATSIQDIQIKRSRGRPPKIRTGLPGRPKRFASPERAQVSIDSVTTPTIKEALNSPLASDWREAMRDEFDALVQCGAWKLTERPQNKTVVGCRWVLRTKYKADGTIEKHKARLVAKGYTQVPEEDFFETFAPVARLSSIRSVLAYCSEKGLTLHQFDFVMAYLNGELDEEIYMEQAEGFVDPFKTNHVYKLQKSLYGLKQAGRQWYKKLDESLKSLGLKPLNTDKCVYHLGTDENELIIIVYVDDLIVATNNANLYQKVKRDLTKIFKMKDLGRLHYCLGIEFHQNEETQTITMSQRKYTDSILEKYNMKDAKPAQTPLDSSIKLSKRLCPTTEEEKLEMRGIPYRSLIGSLMYLSVATRPDITFAVNLLSRYNNNPGKEHWIAAKHVLRYLKRTRNKGLIFHPTREPLIGFTDADWGSDTDDRRSCTGYLFKFAGTAVNWESRKQQTVALSSTEAEYMSLTEAAKEAICLRNMFNELYGQPQNNVPTVVYCDNQGAQKIAKNPVYHSRTKHIDIRYHYIREVLEQGELVVNFVPTGEMAADFLTKPLSSVKHLNCCEITGIGEVSETQAQVQGVNTPNSH